MTGLNLARVAKLFALFGFALPWVLVSCAGEPLGRLTGIDLATGSLIIQNSAAAPQYLHGHPNLWVALSLVAVIIGIVLSFLVRARQAMLAMITTAIVALVASIIGVSNVSSGGQPESQPSPRMSVSKPPLERPAIALGQVDLQYGYFITIAGLLAAIAACGMTLTRREAGSINAVDPL